MKKSLLVIFLYPAILFAQNSDTLWLKGIACYQNRDYHGTVAYMDTLLKITPGFSDGYYNRGIAKITLGNTEDACADLLVARSLGTTINKDFIEYECDTAYLRNALISQFYENEKVVAANGYRPLYTRADTLRGALRPERTCFDVTFYDLNVRIMPDKKAITGSNSIYFDVVEATHTIQIDLFDIYEVLSVTWNNIPLKWHREYNAMFIDFPRELKTGEKAVLKITWRGKPISAPNPPWDGGFVWKHDTRKNLWIGVACEYLGASSWWPVKDHMTDKPDSVSIGLEIPNGYQAISNGDLRKTEKIDKHYSRFVWFVEYPINTYNVTFYVGKYAAFSDSLVDGTTKLRFDYNVLKENLDTARSHFRQTRDVIAFYNKAYGPYPFPNDGFGLVESPYEGMEHQSAIAYGNGYGKNTGNNFRNKIYDYIIVHEAAHEWWGNSVTAADMADIWIHEGFATYSEYIFLESKFGKDEYMYELLNNSRYIFNVWPMVAHRDVNENTFAGNDVYNKGAMMLHCLRCTMNNDSLFFGLIHDFCVKHRYGVVTTNDFIQFANQYTGNDYTAFFTKFLYDTDLPLLEYYFDRDKEGLVIKYRWTEVNSGFRMPFGIFVNNGQSMRLVPGTQWETTKIPGGEWFNFYNLWTGYEGAAENSFTYFNTRQVTGTEQ